MICIYEKIFGSIVVVAGLINNESCLKIRWPCRRSHSRLKVIWSGGDSVFLELRIEHCSVFHHLYINKMQDKCTLDVPETKLTYAIVWSIAKQIDNIGSERRVLMRKMINTIFLCKWYPEAFCNRWLSW